MYCKNQEPCEANPYGGVIFRSILKQKFGELEFRGFTAPALLTYDPSYLSVTRYPIANAMVLLGVQYDGLANMVMLNSEIGLVRTFYGRCEGMP
ncbi:MAG: hypothetical protein AAF744_08835 [Pseudomonadota bacterium]